jgi:hypothetical protein
MSGISMRALLPWALSCMLLALSACGGGGGGSDNGANPASAETPTAPVIVISPASATEDEGQSHTFSVNVTSTGDSLTYQWRLNGTDISGAIGASYSTPTLKLSDSGNSYTVRVSNTQGSSISNPAVLTVKEIAAPIGAGTSPAWTTGQLLEARAGGVDPLRLPAAVIDDNGTVGIVFGQDDGTRTALYAVRGTPGAAGTSPTYGEPVVVDASAPYDKSFGPWLASSPAGNMLVAWVTQAPCTSSTYTSPPFNCKYIVVARFMASSGNWEDPMLLVDLPSPDIKRLRINDAGDIAVVHGAWSRLTDGATRTALSWMAYGDASWWRMTYASTTGPDSFTAVDVTLDAAGHFIAFGHGQSSNSKTVDAVAYRGDVHSGTVDIREVLNTLTSNVTFDSAWAAPGGTVVAAWKQMGPNNNRPSVFLGTLDSASGTWAVRDSTFTNRFPTVTNATFTLEGDFIWHVLEECVTLRYTAGKWQANSVLPSGVCGTGFWSEKKIATARDGGILVIDRYQLNPGLWMLYDDSRREIVKQFGNISTFGPQYLLGAHDMPDGVALLAPKGVGAYVSTNLYARLPTAADPGQGELVSYYNQNLWGWFLK